MTDPDPRSFDWPIPEPGSLEEEALQESLQYASEGIQEDLRLLDSGQATEFIDLLSRTFDESPAPTESVAALERLFYTQEDAVTDFVGAALADPAAFRRLFVLLGHSRHLGGYLIREGWREFLRTPVEDLQRAVTAIEVAEAARGRILAGQDAGDALRLNHHSFATRVLYHEVALARPLEEVAWEVSELADAALAVALEQAYATLQAKRGLTRPEDFKLCVLAMGKHGARELNYSSDIDLIFVYDGNGPGRMDAQAYAVKLVETLIPLLDSVTEHGHVFRVDTRLRPEGKRGRLARRVESTVEYYYSFGSTWERQALIKARACAGDLEIGEQLLERLQGWVYRKYLTLEEINQIKSLKRRIEQRTEQRDEQFTDVKTGFGGIRDIEFATQFLQLMNGGRMPEVRVRATLPALEALKTAGALKPTEAETLAAAYRFLRSVEHRLQVWDDAQTHTVPADPADLLRLGRAMGYRGKRTMDPARVLVHDLQSHTMKARGLMLRLFADLFDNQGASAESELVLDPDITSEAARPLLQSYGFKDADTAFQAIRDLARESAGQMMYEARARKYLASMMPALLEFCGNSPDADFTLRNFERITGALGAKAILFELVAEDPRALLLFGSIAANSNWLTEILVRRPGLVDEFIEELQTMHSLDRASLRRQLGERMQVAADVTDALFWERDVELLRIGLFDLTGRTPLPETLRELCALSEVVLDAALDVAIGDVAGRQDSQLRGDPREHLVVVGMGKLGSGAMNYASDLDLVFAYDPGAFDEPALAQAFYSKVVRRLLSLLSATGERGRLYEVDMRLRPRGSASTLAVTLDELQRYLSTEAGFWERLAGCRARILNPDAPASVRARQIFDEFVYGSGADAAETRSMRERLERESPRNALKRGPGGTLDIEFLLAHLQLKHAAQVPALKQPDLWEVLAIARDHALIDARSYDAIAGSYAYLRQVVNRLQILDGVSRHELPDGDELEAFARRMGYSSGGGLGATGQLSEELEWHRHSARKMFDKYVV
ncbi:MAG: bifunctional [glutamate--ammonia ligase]-adenylyl-L-tyrosine phosphorylase/[glutamate--ammonia-ligase] adenylyltransferase [Planctomycetes bacterium]|nr:bifunctional [glutamate--ammonia ligase]-adenylyl-L-tyrosine phosphorylase/[glutamate--ammonia-ligase] adenylyltransferase [Planctomycetota bacterium]